jgi:hypothetical protein
METESLRAWAKRNGINPADYSDKELGKMRQRQYEQSHDFEWNEDFENAFRICCKRNGLRIKVEE